MKCKRKEIMENSLKSDVKILTVALDSILDKVLELNMWGEKDFDIYCQDPLDETRKSGECSELVATRLTFAIGNALDFVRELILYSPERFGTINIALSFGLAEKVYEAAKNKYVIGRKRCR